MTLLLFSRFCRRNHETCSQSSSKMYYTGLSVVACICFVDRNVNHRVLALVVFQQMSEEGSRIIAQNSETEVSGFSCSQQFGSSATRLSRLLRSVMPCCAPDTSVCHFVCGKILLLDAPTSCSSTSCTGGMPLSVPFNRRLLYSPTIATARFSKSSAFKAKMPTKLHCSRIVRP